MTTSQQHQSSFSNLSVTSPTSQLILQPFRCFTYITAHSPTLPLLHLRHSSFSNPSSTSPTSQALHLHHLVSRPWYTTGTDGVINYCCTHKGQNTKYFILNLGVCLIFKIIFIIILHFLHLWFWGAPYIQKYTICINKMIYSIGSTFKSIITKGLRKILSRQC